MNLSLDGRYVLGGAAGAGVRLWRTVDGVLLFEWRDAGGWVFIGPDRITGPAWGPSHAPGLYLYTVGGSPVYEDEGRAPRMFSSLFGDGVSHWLGELREAGNIHSYDSEGHVWGEHNPPFRSALGISPGGDQVTTDDYRRLILRHVDAPLDQERFIENPDEWTRVAGGFFSRNYRGCWHQARWFACGYRADIGTGGLCVWQPAEPSAPVWWLSADPHDIGPVIASRIDDGRLIVASGWDQGESACRIYEIDVQGGTVRCNGGAWHSLSDGPLFTAPKDPIVRIDRPLYAGWFTGADRSGLPGNCYLQAWQGGTGYVTTNDGRIIAKYIAASSDSDLGELNRLCAAWDNEHPEIPSLGYWTRKAQDIGDCTARIVGVEAYCGKDEPLDAFERRVRAAMGRAKHAWQISQCYTSNANNTPNVGALVPVFARIARDMGEGCLVFSGTDAARGRASGVFDQPPSVLADWTTLFSSVTGLPSDQPKPEPPKPATGLPVARLYEVAA